MAQVSFQFELINLQKTDSTFSLKASTRIFKTMTMLLVTKELWLKVNLHLHIFSDVFLAMNQRCVWHKNSFGNLSPRLSI